MIVARKGRMTSLSSKRTTSEVQSQFQTVPNLSAGRATYESRRKNDVARCYKYSDIGEG